MKKQTTSSLSTLAIITLSLLGCQGQNDHSKIRADQTTSVTIASTFQDDTHGWTAGLADIFLSCEDYDDLELERDENCEPRKQRVCDIQDNGQEVCDYIGRDPFFRIEQGIKELPMDQYAGRLEDLRSGNQVERESFTGFYLQGDNHTDDLAMYLKKQIGPEQGLEPNTTYIVNISVDFATNAGGDSAIGIGGSPSKAVWLKAGGSTIEPGMTPEGILGRMNIDIGAQSNHGEAAAIISDMESHNRAGDKFVLKSASTSSLHSESEPREIRTDDNGQLWLFVGTDSGFEGLTQLYIKSIEATLVKK